MSMLSSKLDAVSKNSIWEEHVKKENRAIHMNETFVISDPRKMDVFPEKPNRTVPSSNPDPVTMETAHATLNSLTVLRDTSKAPPERFALPITGNMEYGFFNTVMAKPNPMFTYKLPSCDVTQYSNEYVKSNNGVGPYNNPNATVGRK